MNSDRDLLYRMKIYIENLNLANWFGKLNSFEYDF